MRIVVVGGSGLIGDKAVTALHNAGHKVVAASPAFGIDADTGEGLDEAMAGADVRRSGAHCELAARRLVVHAGRQSGGGRVTGG